MKAAEILADRPVYRPSEDEVFMSERQLEYFRQKLIDWKEDILREAGETLKHLQSETENHPDLADLRLDRRFGPIKDLLNSPDKKEQQK